MKLPPGFSLDELSEIGGESISLRQDLEMIDPHDDVSPTIRRQIRVDQNGSQHWW